jgi:hypothetical protein
MFNSSLGIPLSNKEERNFIFALVVFKCLLFAYLFFQYSNYWQAGPVEGLAVHAGDTSGYFVPAESLAQGVGYTSVCRMPAFVPIYSWFSAIFNPYAAYQFVVVFQFLMGVCSVVWVARIAGYLAQNKRAYYIAGIIYASSLLIAVWDPMLLSDSFGNSFLILAFYLAIRFNNEGNWKLVLWASLFLTWSIFFRQMHVLFIPVLYFLMLKKEGFVKRSVLFAIPILLAFGSWTAYNYSKTNRFIPLVDSFSSCYGYMPEQLVAIRDLVIAWGEDCQPWVPNSASNYLIARDGCTTSPLSERHYTTGYGAEEMKQLKEDYRRFYYELEGTQKDSLGNQILSRARKYKQVYAHEHPSDYYILNRFRLMKQFLLPARIDNIPGPAFAQMNPIQKGVKIGSFALLLMVNVLALVLFIPVILRDFKGRWWLVSSWVLSVVLGGVLGFIEQRYLVPCYFFFTIIVAVGISSWKFKRSA